MTLENLRIKSKIRANEVESFMKDCDDSFNYFRYYEKRSFDVINNHIQTILLYEMNKPIGYGHLEEENGKVWLGIILRNDKKGKGYGKYIIEYLVDYNKKNKGGPVFLTVDIKNSVAINLFEKSGFKIDSKFNNRSYLMKHKY